jgi:hypothetical protein
MTANNEESEIIATLIPESESTNRPSQLPTSNSFPIFIEQSFSDFAVSGCTGGAVGRFGTSDNQIQIEFTGNIDEISQIDVYDFEKSHHWQFPCQYPTWELVVNNETEGILALFFEPATTISTDATFDISIRFINDTIKQYEVNGLSGECCK